MTTALHQGQNHQETASKAETNHFKIPTYEDGDD
jgi:hypothetical protein